MTANRNWKRRVRARAAATGESYTAALRHLRQTKEQHMRTFQLQPAGRTDTGQVREVNEDSLITEGDLVAVADGMGGTGHGAVASQLAVDTLVEAFAADPTATGLVDAVTRANQALVDANISGEVADGQPTTMGTTIAAVAMVAEGDHVRMVVVNVGDSRVYLLRDGRLSRLSTDHSRVAELVRSGRLTDQEAADHPERHILTAALGIGPEVEPAVTYAKPQSDDRLLLCSDGLYNEVPEQQLIGILTAEPVPDRAAEALIERANERGGNDNITAVVLDVR